MANIGNNIRKFRELKNYTQAHMAEKLGVGQKAYSKIENGETKLTIDRLSEIAKVLDTDVKKLIDFDEKYIYQNNSTHIGDGIVVQKEMPEVLEKYLSKIEILYESRLAEKNNEIEFLRGMVQNKNILTKF